MPAKLVVEPMERSLPVYGADYRSERLASFRLEDDVPADWLKSGRPGTTDADWYAERLRAHLRWVRALQVIDLDDQEAELRGRYDMPVPDKPGAREARIQAARKAQGLPTDGGEVEQARQDLARPGGDFQTADKAAPSTPAQPVAAGLPAGMVRAREVPPPSAMAPVSEGTKDELRAVADQLVNLGVEPYPEGTPSSEADAQEVLRANRARLYDARQKTPPPVRTIEATPRYGKAAATAQAAEAARVALGYKRPDGTEFKAGLTMPAGERRCSHQAHGVRNPQPIDSATWDDSNRIFGRALCRAHMAEARRAAGGR